MEKDLAKKLIKYFKSLGIEVYTNTKARGHQGFFLKNRIDVSKNVKEERLIPTLIHEFSHYIHEKIEPNMARTGGSLEALFSLDSKNTSTIQSLDHSTIENELLIVTNFVDENSHCTKLYAHREQLKNKIKQYEKIIKYEFPHFMRSKDFREFNNYIKKSNARYLLKYDRVQIVIPQFLNFGKKKEIFSIATLESDFPDMPAAFCAYIRMKSVQRKQARNSRRINYYKKYYSKPTELFARFVEGLYLDTARTQASAPYTCQRFFELLDSGYYFELKNVFEMLREQKSLAIF